MLVLTRNRGQKIIIGQSIVVTVQRIQGNRVTLSVEAPSEVHILRGELATYRDPWQETPPSDDRIKHSSVGLSVRLQRSAVQGAPR